MFIFFHQILYSQTSFTNSRKISLNKHEEINSKYKQLRIEQQFKNANYNLNNVSIGKYKNVWKELEPIEYSI